MRGPRRRIRRRDGGLEKRQGPRVVVCRDAEPRALQNRPCRVVRGGRAEDAAGLRRQTGRTKLSGQFHSGFRWEPLVQSEQLFNRRPRLAVPAQHGEQPGAESQVAGFAGSVRERRDRRRIVQEPDVRLRAQTVQSRITAVRSGRIQDFERQDELLAFQETAGLRHHHSVRLDGRGAAPTPKDERERRHGRR